MTTKQEKIVLDNINLVYYTVKKHFSKYMSNEDIIQSGMLGLCKAAIKFDESKGFKFSTYAIYVIYNEIALLFRNINKQIGMLSLDYEYSEESKNNVSLADAIADDNNIIDEVIDNYCIDEILSELYSKLSPREF